jgi:hypothetical protein
MNPLFNHCKKVMHTNEMFSNQRIINSKSAASSFLIFGSLILSCQDCFMNRMFLITLLCYELING